ncbi:CagC family type IV secretion system protein [Enterococcus gallinarum]|uniref:CagC family type IV secretion system protein n=1 Tax=Enterococcus gallinarum TaxID=1353 RepID=UPI0035DFFD0D
MKKFIKDTKFKLGSAVVALGTLFITDPVFAATDPQAKLVQAGNTIKGVLTALIVVVGGIACAKIVIKYLPSIDDPQEKNTISNEGLPGHSSQLKGDRMYLNLSSNWNATDDSKTGSWRSN